RSVSTLAFRALGPADNTGGYVDNISVFATGAQALTDPIEPYRLGSTPTESAAAFGNYLSTDSQSPLFDGSLVISESLDGFPGNSTGNELG
ncbi:MAG: hypothetical protein AAFU53_20025, partial [Cyanobacteria bacterium J06632_3]